MTQSIEIACVAEGVGSVVLEVEYNRLPEVIGAQSDWDSRNHIEIVNSSVFQDGVQLDVDIDPKQLYSIVSARLREVEVEIVFDEEEGGF